MAELDLDYTVDQEILWNQVGKGSPSQHRQNNIELGYRSFSASTIVSCAFPTIANLGKEVGLSHLYHTGSSPLANRPVNLSIVVSSPSITPLTSCWTSANVTP